MGQQTSETTDFVLQLCLTALPKALEHAVLVGHNSNTPRLFNILAQLISNLNCDHDKQLKRLNNLMKEQIEWIGSKTHLQAIDCLYMGSPVHSTAEDEVLERANHKKLQKICTGFKARISPFGEVGTLLGDLVIQYCEEELRPGYVRGRKEATRLVRSAYKIAVEIGLQTEKHLAPFFVLDQSPSGIQNRFFSLEATIDFIVESFNEMVSPSDASTQCDCPPTPKGFSDSKHEELWRALKSVSEAKRWWVRGDILRQLKKASPPLEIDERRVSRWLGHLSSLRAIESRGHSTKLEYRKTKE